MGNVEIVPENPTELPPWVIWGEPSIVAVNPAHTVAGLAPTGDTSRGLHGGHRRFSKDLGRLDGFDPLP